MCPTRNPKAHDLIKQLDVDFPELVDEFRRHIEVQDRTYRLKTYDNCFVGEEAAQWMIDAGFADTTQQAEVLGNLMLEAGVFHHVLRDHDFKCDYLFYRFAEDEDHGHRPSTNGDRVSWADMLGSINPSDSASGLHPRLPDEIELRTADELESIGVEPMDDANIELLDQVHPPGWVNPEPKDHYNMVVIGAGTGGLVTAASIAGLGGTVALVEQDLMGGDCLNTGCVPSKALLRAGRAAASIREAEQFGVSAGQQIDVDFQKVMERVRSVRAHISHHDSAQRFSTELGVDVFLGHARFDDDNTIVVDGETALNFSKACIATGASPAVPPIPGLDEVNYRTNHDLFNLTEFPQRFGVIGAGAIGCEMAQAFARLGADVTLFEMQDEILAHEDAEAAAVVRRALLDDGVDVQLGAEIHGVSSPDHAPQQQSPIAVESSDETREFDELLVATGRRPNVDNLGLQRAQIAYDERTGIEVDDRLQTTNSDVYAVGDVASRYQFTHAADFMARMVVRNALFFGRESFDDLLIPWCTYTEPELAHVGLYPADLEQRDIEFSTMTRSFADVDRAIVDGDTEGFVRLHVDDSATILGATVVGPGAGNLIGEIALAMHAGVTLDTVADVIHPYPTTASAFRELGDQYNRTRLTSTVKKLFRGFLSLR